MTTIKNDIEIILKNPKGLCMEKSIKKRYPQEYPFILKYPGSRWSEKLYNYIYDCPDHICPICGKPTKFRNIIVGYSGYCCSAHASLDDKVKEKVADTCMRRFGARSTFQSEEIKEKIKKTNIERYGSENPFGSKKIREKIKKTNIDHLGVENPFQSEEIKERIKKTNIERYGGFALQSPILKEKVKKTNLERYGVETPLKSKDIEEKIKKTNVEKYGTENPFQSEEIKERIKKTNIERYGAMNYSSAVGKFNNPDLIGYTEDGDWICQCPHPEICNQCQEKYYISPRGIHYDRKHNNTELCTRLLPIQPLFSSYELQVRSWLDDLKIKYTSNDRTIISPLELDIYIPGNRLAIEVNGCYWHSIECKSKSYHYDKWTQCREKEIKMITLWEDWIHDHPSDCLQLIKYHLGIIKESKLHFDWIDNDLVDLGLGSGSIKEHISIHDGYDCWDCGLFI